MIAEHEQVNRRYRLQAQLGAGGMGTVYRAEDRLTGRVIALKRVTTPTHQLVFNSQDTANDPRLALANEFQVLASLRHPHIISVLDYGFESGGQPFFTMSLLENALPLVEAAQGLPLERQLALLIQMLQALAYLHRRGIVHRDLKPANVLVVEDSVRVLDFGLSIIAQGPEEQSEDDSLRAGTLLYMAPEVLQYGQASSAADLYAVGVMAYEIFAGRHPYRTDDVSALLTEVLYGDPDLSQIDAPQALTTVIGRLLAKSPDERYPDAYAAIRALAGATGLPAPVETEAIRESFLQAARFVGREEELAQLKSGLSQITHEPTQGSAWLVGGESGVGKSRLLDELRIRAMITPHPGGGVLVVHGQAVNEGGAPYTLWADILRRLVLNTDLSDYHASLLKTVLPDLDTVLGRSLPEIPPMDLNTVNRELIAAIVALFRAQPQPVVLLLEDLQWAGEGLAVLKALLSVAPDLPLLIVGNYRDDEMPDLPQELPEMTPLKLQRLTGDEIAHLSESMLGKVGAREQVVDLLHRETEGNVFFLVETVRVLAEDAGRLDAVGTRTLPSTVFAGGVRRVIYRRLERVPEYGRELLSLAAVAGRAVDLALLRVLAPEIDIERWLDDCAAAAVLEAREGQWRFAHDKLREAAIERLDDEQLEAMHRRVAEGLEQLYAEDARYVNRLAYHWREAGDREKEIHFSELAGDHALKVSAYRDAREFYTRVLTLQPDAPDARAAQLKFCLAEAYYNLGDFEDARSLGEAALAQARSAGDRRVEANLLGLLGQIYLDSGSPDRARDSFNACLQAARANQNIEQEALALGNLGKIAWQTGALDEAESQLMETLRLAESINHQQRIGLTYNQLGIVSHIRGDKAGSRRYFDLALASARRTGEMGRIAQANNNIGLLLLDEGQTEEARIYLNESARINEQTGNLQSTAITLFNLASAYEDSSDVESARQHRRRAMAIALRMNLVSLLLNTVYMESAPDSVIDADPLHAVRVFSLLNHHPAATVEFRKPVETKLDALRERLPENDYAAAIETGKAMDLRTVARDLLDRLLRTGG